MPYLLALLAAVLFAVSTVLQQGAARGSARRRGPRERADWLPVLGLLGRLLRSPAWLAGWLLNVAGFAAHALALHRGSIAAVQAVLVVQLMVALMLTAYNRNIRLMRRDRVGTVAVCVGVATLVLLRGGVRQSVPARTSVALFVLVVAAVVVTILVIARRLAARVRTALVAVAAGCCFCVTAVLVVVVTHDPVLDWPLLCLVGSAVGGALLVQDSFASGSLPTALTAMTITDPAASALAGVVLFDVDRPSGLELMAGLPVAAALIVTGVVLLANSPTSAGSRQGVEPEQAVDGLRPRVPLGGRAGRRLPHIPRVRQELPDAGGERLGRRRAGHPGARAADQLGQRTPGGDDDRGTAGE
jgi:drug/metabolite transporter (DMT)-like permease